MELHDRGEGDGGVAGMNYSVADARYATTITGNGQGVAAWQWWRGVSGDGGAAQSQHAPLGSNWAAGRRLS